MDHENSLMLRAYQNLFSAMHKSYTNFDIDISYKDFGTFYTIFCFDLTSNACGNTTAHFELERKGNLRLVLGPENVTDPIYIVCYGEFEDNLEITELREVKI